MGGDARVSVEGVAYEVDPDLAGETVILWWGLFDNELYVERDEQRYGPFYPVDIKMSTPKMLTLTAIRLVMW